MTTVLQSLSLAKYRGIRDVSLDDLTSISLLVGANNSGKTSILEAAALLLRPPDPYQWATAVRNRDFDMARVDGLWSMFPDSAALHPEDGPQESRRIVLRGTAGGQPRTVNAWCTVSESLDPQEKVKLAARIEVSVDGQPPLVFKFPRPSLGHQVALFRVVSVTPATHYSTRSMVEHLSGAVEQGKKPLAVDLLALFDPNVEDLDVIASHGREAICVTHRTLGVVDLSSFGGGMRRAAALALALARASQGVLLIDEIETGIHHSVLRSVLSKMIAAAAAAQVQIIATTHSLEAIDAVIGAVDESREPGALSAFWVKREDGKHEVRRYDYEKLRRLREGGLDIR